MAQDQPWDKALGTPLPEEKRRRNGQRTARPRHLSRRGTILVATLAILAAWWGFKSRSNVEQIANGSHSEHFLDVLDEGGSKSRLSRGEGCDQGEHKDKMTCMPEATWQQLVAAKEQIREVAGLRHELAQSEQMLDEAKTAVSGGAAEAKAARAAAADAEKSLQRCQAAERRSRESERAAAAEVQQLHQDRVHAVEALAACDGALKNASQRLARSEQDAATEKEAAVQEARTCCKGAMERVEVLDGELATCQGRLAGLGEGCSNCWRMLDKTKEELHQIQWRTGLMAAAVCITMLATVVTGLYARIMSQRVLQLRLQAEKLRCDAAEAQGGLRTRTRIREPSARQRHPAS